MPEARNATHQQWCYEKDGRVFGPVEFQTIIDLQRSQIAPPDRVFRYEPAEPLQTTTEYPDEPKLCDKSVPSPDPILNSPKLNLIFEMFILLFLLLISLGSLSDVYRGFVYGCVSSLNRHPFDVCLGDERYSFYYYLFNWVIISIFFIVFDFWAFRRIVAQFRRLA